MRFRLDMKLTNADALTEDGETVNPYVVAAYLRDVAGALENYTTSGTVRDGNGVTIGNWAITEDARVPVDMDLFRRTAPAWNCIAYPGEGMHLTGANGTCSWCGEG